MAITAARMKAKPAQYAVNNKCCRTEYSLPDTRPTGLYSHELLTQKPFGWATGQDMPPGNKKFDPQKHKQAMAAIRRERIEHDQSYRARALKLFPHICASCGREFEGLRLKELTVHHKDCDHNNNPPNGSNWELLCLYCHDHEHEKYLMKGHGGGPDTKTTSKGLSVFDGLDSILDTKPE